jgi:hypothetical protein
VTALGTLEKHSKKKGPNGERYDERSDRMLDVTIDEAPGSGMQGAAVVDARGAVLGLTTWSEDRQFHVAPIDVAGKVANDLLTVGTSGP